MTTSPSNERGPHDTARRTRRKLAWMALGMIALGALAVLAFVGYRQPELLLDYVNLRYCG